MESKRYIIQKGTGISYLGVFKSKKEAEKWAILYGYAHYAPFPADSVIIWHSNISLVKR